MRSCARRGLTMIAPGRSLRGATAPLKQGDYPSNTVIALMTLAPQSAAAGMSLGPVRKVALLAALTNELQDAGPAIASTIIEYLLRIAVGNGLAKVSLTNG